MFLAADDRRMEELGEATRDFLAWQHICGQVEELNLTAQQKTQAERRRAQADDTVRLRIAGAYIWALVPEQPDPARPAGWQVLKAEGSHDRLADRVTAKLRQAGLVATTYGARNIRMDLDGPLRSAWDRGHVTVGDLWSYYRRYPYLTRLRDRAVLERALASAVDDMMWETDGFALAEGFDASTGRYAGLAGYNAGSFGHIADTTLVVRPSVAKEQRVPDYQPQPLVDEAELGAPAGEPGVPATLPLPSADESAANTAEPKDVRFFGVVRVNPERYSRDFTRIAQEVLQHLAAIDGTHLEVTIEITATNDAGFPTDKSRVVTENARTLKFDQFGFEDR